MLLRADVVIQYLAPLFNQPTHARRPEADHGSGYCQHTCFGMLLRGSAASGLRLQ